MRIYKDGGDPIEFVQVYGERNSGTTYLAKLLQDNMKTPDTLLGMLARETNPLGHRKFGYKHWFLDWDKFEDPDQTKTLFVVIYRNPYTWLRAMMDRPYALSKSISDRSVAQLPETRLAGHINGKDTDNEFDPDTGEPITIFDLRNKKIAHLEALKSHVKNVVYLNLEAFLQDPKATIAQLAAAFPSAFKADLNLDRAPFSQLIREYENPSLFDAAQTAVLNKAFDWTTETGIGYTRDDYSIRSAPKVKLVILHGGSSVGKTYLMNESLENNADLVGLEMDDCVYWQDGQPMLSSDSFKALVPEADESDFATFSGLIDKKSKKGKRCAEYLLVKLKAYLDQSDTAPEAPLTVIATCGALPDPAALGKPSIYRWLSDRLPVSFQHLLVDVPADVHEQRIAQRGRSHLKDDIEQRQAIKIKKRDNFDAVVCDLKGVEVFTGAPAQPAPTEQPTPARKPRIRLHKTGLKYIQIYGERNSGTKFLTQLISERMRDPDKVLGSYASKKDPINKAKQIGYKHYYPQPQKLAKHQSETLFLVIYKNPYTWIRSMLAKPYHFKDCLKDKTILDLPDLKLAGFDIHGKEIPDVHPETGKRITMFELRAFKIRAWEQLAQDVNNVVYVNYEDLLLSATEMTQNIVDGYGGLFHDQKVAAHIPDERYVQKYRSPKPFTEAEMAVMNAHIDWSAEAIAGYEQDNLFIPD